jgi:BolA protein
MVAMTNRLARIESVLRDRFAPTVLQVEDDSAKHAGHAGAQPGGETHYSVLLVSDRFDGLGRVGRHRLVNEALAQEFGAGLHALALTLKAPGER